MLARSNRPGEPEAWPWQLFLTDCNGLPMAGHGANRLRRAGTPGNACAAADWRGNSHPSALRPELRARSRLGRSHGFHCLAIISSTQVFAAFLSLASAHSPSCQYINSPHSPAAPLGWAATIPVAAAMASTRTASSFNLEGMLCSPLSLVKGGGEKASECYSF